MLSWSRIRLSTSNPLTYSLAVRALCCSSVNFRSPVFVARFTSQTLTSFHWLCAPERIKFKLAVIVYQALHGTAPWYLFDLLSRAADMLFRSRLWSSTFNQLTVQPSRLVTVGERSFASACSKLWNSLPNDITSASSLTVFRWKLKTHLFRQSYPDIIL